MSPTPVRYAQVPKLSALFAKLQSSLDSALEGRPVDSRKKIMDAKSAYGAPLTSLLEDPKNKADIDHIKRWNSATLTAIEVLKPAELFPAIDLLRLGVLNESVAASFAATSPSGDHPLLATLAAVNRLDSSGLPRPLALTSLRLFSNVLLSPTLAQLVMASPDHRSALTSLVVHCLLSSEADVRTSAGSLAYGMVAWWSRGRTRWIDEKAIADEDEESWEVEMLTALGEALQREKENVDVGECESFPPLLEDAHARDHAVHRLVATIGCLLFLSPNATTALQPLAEALDLQRTLKDRGTLLGAKEKELLSEVQMLLRST